MDAIVQSLSLGLLLRCIVAGASFVISYFTATDYPQQFEKIGTLGLSELLPLALLVGVVAYSIHRSLIYPIIEWFMNADWVQSVRRFVPLISKSTITSLVRRWRRGADDGEAGICREHAKHISVWADYTHLQYASALCVGLGALAAQAVTPKLALEPNRPLIFVTALFLTSALISDWRLRSVDDQCANRNQQ